MFLIVSGAALNLSARTVQVSDSVIIVKRTVILVRSARIAGESPHRRRATVTYPIIKGGIRNSAALAKVRSLLQIKNIFDSSLEDYRQDTWLTELGYRVDYNKNFILDITFTQSGVGAYPDSQDKHLAVNLKTGEIIKAADVFKADSLERLAEMIDKKLQAEIRETIREANDAKDISEDEKNGVSELFDGLKFEVKNLDDFSISGKGITFLYDAGFPHVIQAYQPVGRYQFTYAELGPYLQRPDGPQRLIQ
jgi:hypothetical protein